MNGVILTSNPNQACYSLSSSPESTPQTFTLTANPLSSLTVATYLGTSTFTYADITIAQVSSMVTATLTQVNSWCAMPTCSITLSSSQASNSLQFTVSTLGQTIQFTPFAAIPTSGATVPSNIFTYSTTSALPSFMTLDSNNA